MSKLTKPTLEVRLADADPESLGTVTVRISASDFTLSICPQGYGDFTSEDGAGCPLMVEFYQGRLRVIAFPDINCEDAEFLDLSGAREDQRGASGESIDRTPAVSSDDHSEHRCRPPAPAERSAEPCECEQTGHFCSGVPGVIAHVEHGRLEGGIEVQRCDACQRYPTDEIAFLKLVELGMA